MARIGHVKLERRLAWVLASMTASILCFIIYAYHGGTYLDWRSSVQHLQPPAQPESTTPEAPKSPESPPGQSQPNQAGAAAHLPAWVETPKVFDVAQIQNYQPPPFSLGTPIALHPQLAQAVDRFLSRPVLTHKQASRQNQAACPLEQANAQVNADQLKNDREKWLAVDPETIDRMRRGALDYLEQHTASEGEPALIGPGFGLDGKPVRQGSRGIVFAAGNHRTVDRAIGCIKEIQKLGWQRGAIEVFHFEGELTDEGQRQQLRDLGATPHMVCAARSASSRPSPFLIHDAHMTLRSRPRKPPAAGRTLSSRPRPSFVAPLTRCSTSTRTTIPCPMWAPSSIHLFSGMPEEGTPSFGQT